MVTYGVLPPQKRSTSPWLHPGIRGGAQSPSGDHRQRRGSPVVQAASPPSAVVVHIQLQRAQLHLQLAPSAFVTNHIHDLSETVRTAVEPGWFIAKDGRITWDATNDPSHQCISGIHSSFESRFCDVSGLFLHTLYIFQGVYLAGYPKVWLENGETLKSWSVYRVNVSYLSTL